MAWIELHQSLFTHRKTVEAAAVLDLPEVYVVGHLAAIWTWALDNAPNGVIKAADRVIEKIAQWPGDRGALIAAMVAAGFLTETAAGYEIHDWDTYAGKLIERRERNAARMREARASTKTDTVQPRATHVRDTCKATQPNPTQPNSTSNTLRLSGESAERGEDAPSCGDTVGASASPGTMVPMPPKAKTNGNRGTRLPEGWLPSQPDVQSMRKQFPDFSADAMREETEKFRDHWKSQSGSKGVKLDWAATWRNWIRTAHERQSRHPLATPRAGAKSPAEIVDSVRRETEENFATLQAEYHRYAGAAA